VDANGKLLMGPDPRGGGRVINSVFSIATLVYNPVTGQITGNRTTGGTVTGVAGSEMSIAGAGAYYPGMAFTISDAKHPINPKGSSVSVFHH